MVALFAVWSQQSTPVGRTTVGAAATDVPRAVRVPIQAPLFTLKAKLFADSTFVIGYDTAIRLIMPKYYGGEVTMLLELAAMRYR
jgi:hypothetical protein